MKEMRSVVNAVFLFLVFLVAYALVVPGHARGTSHGPRFLRMQVEDSHSRHRGRGDRINVSIPYGLFSGALRFASMGRVRRELDLHFDQTVDSAALKDIWKELQEKPEGTEVSRTKENAALLFRKDGDVVTLDATRNDDKNEGDSVRIRVPARLVQACVSSDRDLDVDALLSELRTARAGELVDVQAKDAHVRIWVE